MSIFNFFPATFESYSNLVPATFHLSACTHITQNIAETCQKYFQSFIADEILLQHFCQILQNFSPQH